MNNQDIVASLKKEISKATTAKESIVIIADYAKKITGADRCSLFLFSKEKDQLRSIYTDGIKGAIVLRSNAGIVGYAFHKRESVLENDTASSSIFLSAVDQKSGYKTKTILAVPIISSNNTRLGVIQLLNKKEGFDKIDKENIELFAKEAIIILNPQQQKTQTAEAVKNKEETTQETYQNRFDHYLRDKKLFIMEDGSVYYKIRNMIRDYFIGADKCYLLESIPKTIEVYYFSQTNDFLSLTMLIKIDEQADALLVSDKVNNQNFVRYPLEED